MEITIKDYRKEMKDFVKSKVKSSLKPYQRQAEELLKLDDEALDKWRTETQGAKYSFLTMTINSIVRKEEDSKYKRLCKKATSWDFEEWSEAEEEFISYYEEEHNIEDTIL